MTNYDVLKQALEKIASVNAMDYEYQAWAREALANQPAQQEPWEHLKAYGYAPGGYMMTCRGCNSTVTGVDKRASRCMPCATKAAEQQIAEALRAHGLTLVKTESGYKALKLGQITALDNQPTPPPECQTDAEKTAFAFGWWKALEHIRMKKSNQYSDIVSTGGMDPRK